MISLCTDKPTLSAGGERTLISFPSGEGEPVTVALNRAQLVALCYSSRRAMVEAFDEDTPEPAEPISIRARRKC